MLSAFVSSFRTPDLRRKILLTLGVIALYRVGAALESLLLAHWGGPLLDRAPDLAGAR